MSMIPENQNLFVVDLTYTVPFDEIEPHIDAHMDFISALQADGTLLAAGRKEPRTGGIVLATAPSLEMLRDRMAQDPFAMAGVADYAITEFLPNTRHPDFN